MSKEIVEGLENLSNNVEYIIDWLETNKSESSNVDTTSVDFISNEINSFSGYLKDIDSKMDVLNNTFSGFLDNIPLEDNLNDTPEVTQFNQSMLDMISKIDELKSSLDTLNMDLSVDFNSEELSRIKEELQSSLDVNLDSSFVDDFITNINTALNDVDNLKLDLNIDESLQNIQDLKTNLESLNELDLESVNLEVFNNDNIDSIISDLEALNNLDIDLNVNTNLEEIVTSIEAIKDLDLSELNLESLSELSNLENIKDLDLSNLNLDIDLTPMLSDLNVLTESLDTISNYDLEMNIVGNATEIIDNLKVDIESLSTSFTEFNIVSNVDVLPTTESMDNLQSELDKQELTISPTIDTTQIEDLITDKFEVNINPAEAQNVEGNNIETNLNNLDSIKPEAKVDSDKTIMVEYLKENNKVLSELSTAIKGINSGDTSSNKPIEVEAEKVSSEPKSTIVNVESPKEPSNDISNATAELLKQLVIINSKMLTKLSKSGFDTSMDF